MSYLFISHSSENDFESLAIKEFLVAQGWNDIFLDLDPKRGIVAGQRWETALHQAADKCDAVLFLVSEHWLNSQWCLNEFKLALKLNKKMIGLLIEDLPMERLPKELVDTWQVVNLASGNDHKIISVKHPLTSEEKHVHFSVFGLTSLKTGLKKAGFDPLFFDWPPENDPNRVPYRGMAPLEAEDAGIFFGREAPTQELIAKLKHIQTLSTSSIMAILGASGAGKSSFLRAGILPRLNRDESHFFPLPTIRPEKSSLWGENGLLNALYRAVQKQKIQVSRVEVRKIIEGALKSIASGNKENIAGFLDFVSKLSQSVNVVHPNDEIQTPPTPVICIDQGEELFNREGIEEANEFLNLLSVLVSQSKHPIIVLFTIRSDSFEKLQTYKAFEGITQQTFSLAPLPQGAYHSVIEGPAQRLVDTDRSLKIEPALTQQLSLDIERGGNRDALPLLAFTLERLYIEYSNTGHLTLKDYKELGGIEGAIEAAVELAISAAMNDPLLPNSRDSIIALLHRGLIPWLAGIDPLTQMPRRRVAKLSEIPEESRPIINHLVSQRLLLLDVDEHTKEVTIEPAHEAMLRQWGLLKGWLEEDFASLSIIESIQRASRDWLANNKNGDWLSHSAGRLQDAFDIKTRDDLAQFLTPDDWHYLNACKKVEDDLKNRELNEAKALLESQQKASEANRTLAKRTTLGMGVAIVLMVLSGYFAYKAINEQQKAVAQRLVAEQARENAQLEADKAKAVNQFMLSIFEAANPYLGGNREIQLIAALDQSVSFIDRSFSQQPIILAAVSQSIGENYLALEDIDKAEPLLTNALKIRRENLEPNDPDLLISLVSIGNVYELKGQYEESKKSFLEAWEMAISLHGEQSMKVVGVLDELTNTYLYLSDFESAKKAAEDALAIRRALESSNLVIAKGLHSISRIASYQGNWAEAETPASQALQLIEDYNEDPIFTMQALNQNAVILTGLGRFEQAEAYYKKSIDIANQHLGPNHGETVLVKENLGNIWFQQKRYDETIELLKQVLIARESAYGPNHELVARTNANIGVIHMSVQQYEQAQSFLENSLAIFKLNLPKDHPNIAHMLNSIAINQINLNRIESALTTALEARDIRIQKFGEQSWQVGRTEFTIGRAYKKGENISAAREWLTKAIEKLKLHPDPNYSSLTAAEKMLSEL